MSARFSSVLVANRGEIACRIINAARAEGYRAVAVFSEADADAPHIRLADVAVRIGPPPAAQSYLSIPALIAAARVAGAEAIHPGYGFLAESVGFAEACVAADLVFIGPPPDAIRAMGDKAAAKALMQNVGVPCAPGYHGEDQSAARFAEEGARLGYPVMVKASAGGGGRGMRLVRTADELEPALRSARAEASSAFGNGRLILERALLGARHVEIQIFADEHAAIVHLGERDCSIQRRHQKLIEESPSPVVSPELRARMGEAAMRTARAVGYVGAGTVEFLLAEDGQFHFLEMNTRIQVEHPVTECVTGLDLVRLQFHVAQGRPLPFAQSDVLLRGHAIEARLYAEDPGDSFLPTTGRVVAWRPGGGEGVRIDHGVAVGAAVTSYYDSLLAKIIVFARDRESARLRLARALRATFIAGVTTNRDFLLDTLGRPEFINGEATTAFVAASSASAIPPGREAVDLAALLFVERGGAPAPSAPWRESPLRLAVGGAEYRVAVRRHDEEWIVALGDEAVPIRLVSRTGEDIRFSREGVVKTASYARDGDILWLDLEGKCLRFADQTYAPPQRREEKLDGAVRSPVNGVIVGVEAKTGDRVRRGQTMATVEAMKMQYSIVAQVDGVVAHVNAVAGLQAHAALSCSRSGRTEANDLDKTVVTCALTGVLTDPAVYPAPVTPEAMAREARRACDQGASVVHVHFRRLEPGKGHLPSWEPEVATTVIAAIRDACPSVIVNQTTGVVGPDISGPLACLKAVRPEIAALNAGSLNYLKTHADGSWAWPPMLFDNPVEKVAGFLAAMREWGIEPEFECFDTGIVRAAAAIARNCGYDREPKYNFVMGVESGMPADPELLPILTRLITSGARWSVAAIWRKEIWPLHRRAAELGGDLRIGLEDTIHLPDGARASSNGELVGALAAVAREAGRDIASTDEARRALALSSHEEARR